MVKADHSVVETIDEMKKLILSSFPSDVPQQLADKLEFGYVEPGHGLKGKKEWIVDDNDVQEFWEKCGGKKEATLWCYSQDHHTVRKLKEGPNDHVQNLLLLNHLNLVPHGT